MRLLLLFLLAISFSTASSQEPKQEPKKGEKGALERKDTRVEPTSWGHVWGRVYDADTGMPIKEAAVIVQNDGIFAEKGQTLGKTDELGAYKVKAVLGRISHNFDIGRALFSSPLGMLFGSATNTTKRIDVARVNLRVAASGYKPFECPVGAREQDAGAFRISMEPILLVPEKSEGVSTSASGWGAVRIDSAQVEPAIAKPGEKVKVKAWLFAVGGDPKKTVELSASCPLWKGYRKLKPVSTEADGRTLFELEYGVGKKEKTRVEIVELSIRKSVLDYSRLRTRAPALIQIAASASDELIAQSRREAVLDLMENRKSDANEKFTKLASGSPRMDFDLVQKGQLAEDLADYPASVAARKAYLEGKKDVDFYALRDLARVLYLDGKYDQVLSAVEPPLGKVKEKEQPKLLPPSLLAYQGLAYVKLGKLEQADKVNERLLKWEVAGLADAVIEFRNVYRMAEVEKGLAAAPNSALARADYGRALLDMGRYEEAYAALLQAYKADPSAAAIKRDLAWAGMRLQAPEEAPTLDDAITQAELELKLDDKKLRSKDYFTWQQYAVLLYAKAEEQRTAQDAGAQATFEKSVDAFREALRLGRVGAKRNAGSYSSFMGQYLTGSEVAISGFAYPQANSSFVLLESLKLLVKNPEDPLALFNITTALLELDQPKLAGATLQRLKALRPDFSETLFLEAIMGARMKQTPQACENLSALVKLNPRHPKANLLLSELLVQEGDTAGAAEAMARHSRWYGGTMVIK